MITKWICIPYGIITVVMAGFVKSVIPEYLSSYSMWYSSSHHYSILEYALVFGVFGGIITGLLVDTLKQRVSLVLAAILALISFILIPHFDGSSMYTQEDWHFYVLASLVFIAGQSASLAIIATLKVNLVNFSIAGTPMIMSIILSYLYIWEHVETSLRRTLFSDIGLLGIGIAMAVIYISGAIILSIDTTRRQNNEISQYHLAALDKVGLSIFIIYALFMVLLLLLFKLILKDVTASTWIWIILLLGNFLIPILNAEFILNRASDLLRGYAPDIDELYALQRDRDKQYLASMKSIKLLILFVANVLLVGTGTEIYGRLSKISIAIQMSYLAEFAMIWYVFGDYSTRLLVGLVYTGMNKFSGAIGHYKVNDFTYMFIFALEIVAAVLIIVFTPTHSVIIFHMACFIGGSGVGGLWVMTPIIIAQDYGQKYFGVIWGTFTLGMEIGVWIFSMHVFDHYHDKYNKDRWGRCTKPHCFTEAFVVSAIWAAIGLILIALVWFFDKEDQEEGTRERNRLEEQKDKDEVEFKNTQPNKIQLA